MPEPVISDKKEEPKEKPIGIEVREKSFQQILQEQQAARTTPTDEKPELSEEDKKKQEDENAAKDAQEAKEKIEAEEAAKKRDEEIATKAAEETVKRQEEAKKKEEEKATAEAEAKKKEEALKPKWQTDPNAPKDEKGNPIPRSYDEIAAEAARIGKEEALAVFRAEQQAEKLRQAEDAQAKLKTEEDRQAAEKAKLDQLQKEMDADLNDLYATNKLPKVKDEKDPNDLGMKEFKNLFETAQRVNAERMASGKAPIRSLKLIYYEHYKPLIEPAGKNAPVFGNESPVSHEAPEDRYIPARDRRKSMTQLFKEEAARQLRKVGVRGS